MSAPRVKLITGHTMYDVPGPLEYLRVYKPENQTKKRLGNDNDGGYVICIGNDDEYDLLLSGGIADNIFFEKDFLNLYPGIQCIAFDGSIKSLPNEKLSGFVSGIQWIPVGDSPNEWIQIGSCDQDNVGETYTEDIGESPNWGENKANAKQRKFIGFVSSSLKIYQNPIALTWSEANTLAENNPCLSLPKVHDVLAVMNSMSNLEKIKNITFVNKNLGKLNSVQTSNLRDYIDNFKNIFLKLDIEGGEDELFGTFSKNDLKKFKQIVIEFHSPYQYTIPTRLAETHWLCHIHPNNYESTTLVKGTVVPNVFECTYVRKNSGEDFDFNDRLIPDPVLDMPNQKGHPDICLAGYPYSSIIGGSRKY